MPFRTSTRTTAYRTLVRILRNDPDLDREVRTWRVWEGQPDDNAAPSSNQSPWIRLTPTPDGSEWADTGSHRSPMVVQVETFVTGTNIDQAMDFWGTIEVALFPQVAEDEETVAALWSEAGVVQVTITQPAFGTKDLGKDSGGLTLYGTGAITLELFVST